MGSSFLFIFLKLVIKKWLKGSCSMMLGTTQIFRNFKNNKSFILRNIYKILMINAAQYNKQKKTWASKNLRKYI